MGLGGGEGGGCRQRLPAGQEPARDFQALSRPQSYTLRAVRSHLKTFYNIPRRQHFPLKEIGALLSPAGGDPDHTTSAFILVYFFKLLCLGDIFLLALLYSDPCIDLPLKSI